jgi:hypothetical protein
MKDDAKILAGTVYHTSIVGHNNFVYPSTKSDTIIEDTKCIGLSFVGGGSKTAVKVPESAIKYDGDTKRKVIIWVEKCKIL